MSQDLKLRRRLLLPIALGILAVAGGVITTYYLLAQHGLDEAFNRKLDQSQSALHALLDERGKKLALSADSVIHEKRLLEAFQAQDRRSLLQHAKPVFEHLRTSQQITHLYFHGVDLSVFLRVHQPEAYGDLTGRLTLSAAAKSRQPEVGVEIGTLGDLTLRTVIPWFYENNLVGYVEIGQEISPIIGELKRVFGLDAYAVINKQFTNQESFEKGRQILGRENHWNSNHPVVVIYQTMVSTPPIIMNILDAGKITTPRLVLTSANGKRLFQVGILPIDDVGAIRVGHVVLLDDITHANADVLDHVRFAAMLGAAIALILIAAVFDLVYRTELNLARIFEQQREHQSKIDRANIIKIEELEQRSLYDRSSTLPNRILFFDRLSHHIYTAQRDKKTFALVILEITNHKPLLDMLGERLMDQLEQQIGFRLKEGLRKSDTIARYAEDQYIAVLPSVNLDLAVAMAQKLKEVLSTSFSVETLSVEVKAIQGIALYPYHGQDGDTLVRRADTALRNAAQNNYPLEVYDSRKESTREQQLQLLTGLQHAISNDELQLHYFPRVGMRTRKINGVEALLRWRHNQQGAILPDEIIPMAENTGLIRPLAEWVVNRALRQQSQWQHAGIDLFVSINLSSVNLLDGNFLRQLRQLLSKWKTRPQSIGFEISEKIITSSPKKIGEAIKQIHALGCEVAIDDVGVGNSSLAYLKTLPVAQIKLDTSIIQTLPDNQNNVAFVRSTIQLAHGLGIDVVAEGVKNKAAWDMLNTLGCDMAQGYHICQPLTSGAFECWLVNSKYGTDKRGVVCAVRVETESE